MLNDIAIEYDWYARRAVYSPLAVAVAEYESGRSMTYAELHVAALATTMLLWQEAHIQQGDRVAILAENSLEHVVLLGGAQKLGYILVPLNYRCAAAELDGVLSDAKPRIVFVEEKYRSILENIPSIKAAQSVHILEEWFGRIAANSVESTRKAFPEPALTPQSPLLLLYTSGTTGMPKGVIYSHGMLFWNSINTGMSWDLTAQDRTVNCLPMFHTGGWNVLLTPLLHRGGTTILMKKFDAEVVLRLLHSECCTIFMGVPTILQMMASSPAFATQQLSALRYIVAGGEPMPMPLIEAWQQRGIPVRQGYGMTEVGPNIFSLHHHDAVRKIGSIGQPNFYVHACIVDDNGNSVPQGEPGELWVRGPMVTPGYWNNPEETRKAFHKDGWFATGDMARCDEEGYYYITDRKKHMFISGGENVYPAEVERVLYTHPAVREAAVVGVPDPQWGEVGKAFVVLEPSTYVDAHALRAYCRERLAGYKVPKYIEFLPELPKNDAGKINKKILR
ncbi:MAG: long-chain fatty acid--CoA ligase [Bacteroidota bacterium]|nr:long-chain fatty acid--CoA ligase [Candidatus Kapabacteria bacterium]MDW8220850.1 long-chain fatty acid--CoA ligase [Bacteroidota bacterium]